MLARTVLGKEKLEQIEPARLCIPERGKKKKLTRQTMSLERQSCSIFGSDDGFINHNNESGDTGIMGKQKQMTS